MSCEPCCPPFLDDRCEAFERKEFGSVYSASLSAWFPLFWEMQFESVTVELAWDSGLTWISDSFTYSGETYVATLVISGLERKDAVVTLTGPAYSDVVYKNKWGFIPLGANRMFADQSASDGDIDGLSACLYPKTVLGECDGCENFDIASVIVDGLFGVFAYHPSTVDTVGSSGPSCLGSGEGGLHTVFTNPQGTATCRFQRYQCGVNPWTNTFGNGRLWQEIIHVGNPDGASPVDMQIRVSYSEADGSGGIYNTVYEYHFSGSLVPCLDVGEYTLNLVSSNKPGAPSSITVTLSDA